MSNQQLQNKIIALIKAVKLTPQQKADIKAVITARLAELETKDVCSTIKDENTQIRENASAIGRKTHWHLKSIDRTLRELIEIIKSNQKTNS